MGVGEEEWDAKGKWVRCTVEGETCERGMGCGALRMWKFGLYGTNILIKDT